MTVDEQLRMAAADLSQAQLTKLVSELPDSIAEVLLEAIPGIANSLVAESPVEQAKRLIEDFAERDHLTYLSDRIREAVEDVESGHDRRIIIEMPPRSGKSLLATQVTPAWCLAKHPDWPILVTSYSGQLATSWGRQVRRWVSEGRFGDAVKIAPDAGAASDWETEQGGALRSRSIREALTGYGGKVLIIDDPHKDFTDAHSKRSRDEVWSWFSSVAQTRLQPPSLVIVIMTRWHEDDLVGRILSKEYDGDPADWEVIRLPALAEEGDVLKREVGDPLYSPLLAETRDEALTRWAGVKRAVGAYTWSALYQQRPAPAEGVIFSMDNWKYWTTDPDLADGERVVLLDTNLLVRGQWVDSWDCAFKGTATSDFVAGQRWVRVGADRFLMAQQRDRWSFTQTLNRMETWARPNDPAASPWGGYVHQRLIEDAANGPAIIDSLKRKISGLKPIRAEVSKEARARAVTPEIESGNVFLPYPSQAGHEWVNDYLSEFRNFPNDAHDDQVDATTQALLHLRAATGGGLSNPASRSGAGAVPQSRVSAAHTLARR